MKECVFVWLIQHAAYKLALSYYNFQIAINVKSGSTVVQSILSLALYVVNTANHRLSENSGTQL